MKGFKAFDKDLKCRGFQYEVGNTYVLLGKPEICGSGFHFCEKLENVYGYYERSVDTRICEVEALGEVVTEGDKTATNKIKIIRELSGKEFLNALLKGNNSGDFNSGSCNQGDYNSGYCNSGNRNSGNCNSGNYNSGDYNSGNCNSGNRNSGNCNSGDCNSGNYNSGNFNQGNCNSGNFNQGNCNSGNYNSGNYNSGDYNSGNYNLGFFNSNTPFVRLFNKETTLKWDNPIIYQLQKLPVKPILRWIRESHMTEQEKSQYPSYKTTGGILRNTGRVDWSEVLKSKEHVKFISDLPNFDDEVFKEVTGHSLFEVIKPEELK